MRFLARQHIRSNADFLRIKGCGQGESLGVFALRMLIPGCLHQQEEPIKRFGVVASKRVGIAVKRNRAKRVFREIFRLNQDVLPASCDVVIIAYANFEKCSFEELQSRYRSGVEKLLKRINGIKE
ncbi:MAG: ribonuclease P protein component [Verrucomicrobia bacterium GWC2_42_7]|nr:MAG: ribonuclease P protein component [Verrucomicrobia bacterium GWC2_42_7]